MHCGSPRKSASQAQGSVSVSGNEVRDQPSRSMLALGQLDPARQQTGHEWRGHEARRHVSGAQLARQPGHLVVALGIEHEDPRVGSPLEDVIEVLQPLGGMPAQVDQHDGQASPIKRLSRSARDRVSNQRTGRSCSRGRSCLFQLPSRSCKITATRVKIRPLLSAIVHPGLDASLFSRHESIVSRQGSTFEGRTRRRVRIGSESPTTRLTRQSPSWPVE